MNENEKSPIMRVVKKLAKTKLSSLAIHKLEQVATKVGVEEQELFQLYVEAKNRSMIDSFASIPYNERIVLLPQCLRGKDCPAEIGKYGYECQQCGRCSIAKIMQMTKDLGYKGTFILPGGSLAQKIMLEIKPKASLGVACAKELILGSYLCEKVGVIGQGVELLKDGCINTIVDLKVLKDSLKVNVF
ncbi:MAG: DUF116 domain-containing protein [Candidatus Bathyarchaeota archaeon]|nr:DUF116 domain-containing protein [Candidatus Bathyarchaeum sp.]